MVLRLTSLSLSSLLWVSMTWAGNTVFVNQSGNNVVINIEQIGDGNSVTGQNGTPVQLHGDNNTALVKQLQLLYISKTQQLIMLKNLLRLWFLNQMELI